jgi:hypothetical protein
MLQATIYNSNANDNTGNTSFISTKTTVIGLCTVEVVGTGTEATPTVTVQGKLVNSDDAAVDTGWVDIVTFTNIDINTTVGKAIGVFTFLRAKVSNNGDNANVTVCIGYN